MPVWKRVSLYNSKNYADQYWQFIRQFTRDITVITTCIKWNVHKIFSLQFTCPESYLATFSNILEIMLISVLDIYGNLILNIFSKYKNIFY